MVSSSSANYAVNFLQQRTASVNISETDLLCLHEYGTVISRIKQIWCQKCAVAFALISCWSSCVLLFVRVWGLLLVLSCCLPLPAVAWQGDTAADSPWAGECRRQSSGMTNPSGARIWLNGAEIPKGKKKTKNTWIPNALTSSIILKLCVCPMLKTFLIFLVYHNLDVMLVMLTYFYHFYHLWYHFFMISL